MTEHSRHTQKLIADSVAEEPVRTGGATSCSASTSGNNGTEARSVISFRSPVTIGSGGHLVSGAAG